MGEGSSETKPHRIHAAPSKGNSFDLGGWRWRPDGDGLMVDKAAIAYRIAFTWNLAEGIPLEALQAGCVREFYDRALALADLVLHRRRGAAAKAREVLAAYEAHRFDLTGGTLTDCRCNAEARHG